MQIINRNFARIYKYIYILVLLDIWDKRDPPSCNIYNQRASCKNTRPVQFGRQGWCCIQKLGFSCSSIIQLILFILFSEKSILISFILAIKLHVKIFQIKKHAKKYMSWVSYCIIEEQMQIRNSKIYLMIETGDSGNRANYWIFTIFNSSYLSVFKNFSWPWSCCTLTLQSLRKRVKSL